MIEVHEKREQLDVRQSVVTNSVFDYVNLSNTGFSNVNLSSSVFERMNLSNLRIDDANMGNARINDANLSGSKISNANLGLVDIERCAIDGMRIDGVLVTEMLAAYRTRGVA